MRHVAFGVLAMVWLLSGGTASEAKKAAEVPSRERLAETAELFFGADPSYRSGDLLVRSQVAGFQDYLRKTQGTSLATRSRLLKRIEPDNSRLAHVFFSKNGRSTLRVAAQELGGYEPLVCHSRTKRGFQSLQEAAKLGQASQLVEQIVAKEALEKLAKKPNTRPTTSRLSRIYTEEQLLDAMLSRPSSQKKQSTQREPSP